MKPRFLILAGATVAAFAAAAVMAQQSDPEQVVEDLTILEEPVTADMVAQGQEIYTQSCASCHGVSLEGQPNWKRRLENGRMPAPPHDETGHTWHHSDRNLFVITKVGVEAVVPGYESDMPAFEAVLTDDQIAAVLAYIKSTWPEKQREFQAEVSANDKGEL